MIYEESFPASNLLGREASPYLLQHAGNPVHWRSWGPDAFHEARVRDLPILLSVGYAACHWCHVMAHESFENPATAAVMNRLFVNVKVDREERPEVDQIYMAALHALGEQGGWPLTMFLTPEGAPFWGGTYFPPEPRYGRAGFVQVLEAVADAYRSRADAVHQNGTGLLSALAEPPRRATGELGPAFLAAAAKSLLGVTDPVHGGLKGAPKFPNAAMLELLWRSGRAPAERASRDAVLTALERMANGGIYDHIGGGFARYSVDHRWLVPHFEKMLYDNAQLVGLLTIAYVDTGENGYRRRVEETVAWLLRDMLAEGGAFAASVDADSEGEEGLFYLWKPGEVDAALGYQDGAVFANAYDVSPQGNFEGRSIPNRLIAGFPTDSEEERLAPLRERMRAARALRSAPGRDDKVLADWNGLAIAALADAGRVFGNEAWIAAAEHAFGRVIDLLGEGDRLGHSARAGKRVFPGLSTDYGAMIRAAIALAEATEDESFIGSGAALARRPRSAPLDRRPRRLCPRRRRHPRPAAQAVERPRRGDPERQCARRRGERAALAADRRGPLPRPCRPRLRHLRRRGGSQRLRPRGPAQRLRHPARWSAGGGDDDAQRRGGRARSARRRRPALDRAGAGGDPHRPDPSAAEPPGLRQGRGGGPHHRLPLPRHPVLAADHRARRPSPRSTIETQSRHSRRGCRDGRRSEKPRQRLEIPQRRGPVGGDTSRRATSGP